MKKIGGILYVKRLLGDVVHGFRQMSNVPRRDSSHRDTAVLNNYLASLLDSKYEEFIKSLRFYWNLRRMYQILGKMIQNR